MYSEKAKMSFLFLVKVGSQGVSTKRLQNVVIYIKVYIYALNIRQGRYGKIAKWYSNAVFYIYLRNLVLKWGQFHSTMLVLDTLNYKSLTTSAVY